jgi:hypothetical protein
MCVLLHADGDTLRWKGAVMVLCAIGMLLAFW